MKSLDVLKAKVVVNKIAIAITDAAHENYMGRTTWDEYMEAISKAKFEACCELENIIEKLEEENAIYIQEAKERESVIEALGKERKRTHEEITIICGNRRAES